MHEENYYKYFGCFGVGVVAACEAPNWKGRDWLVRFHLGETCAG